MSHFLQSPAWAQLQRARGREVVELSGQGWSAQGFIERGKLNTRLYVPYGPVLDSEAALAPALTALAAAAKQLGAAFIRVEPTLHGTDSPAVSDATLTAAGLRKVSRVQPEHTQRIDLQRPFTDVVKDFKSTNRNLHRNYTKKGLSVERSTDPAAVEHLIRLLREVSDRTGMHAHADEYLRVQANTLVPSGSASVYLVHLEGEPLPIAAALIYDDSERRYYGHAAANTEHRKLSPGVILVTQMIEDAHAAGQQEFDLYGVVPPEVRDHAWTGFSDFKRSFGGHQVTFSGTWELPVRRASYAVYRLAQRVLGDR